MQLLHDTFIVLAVSQLLTTCLYFMLHHRTQSGLLFVALFVCLATYVGWSHSGIDAALGGYLYLLSLFTPILLYAIARYLFIDEAGMKPVDWVLAAYFVIFRVLLGGLVYSRNGAGDTVLLAAYMLPLAILIYFSVMAAVYTIQGYKTDLLENRRTLRVYFVISTLLFIVPRLVMGLLVYSSMLLEGSEFIVPAFPELIYPVYIFLIFLAFNLLIFQRHEDLFRLFTETPVISRKKPGPAPTTQQSSPPQEREPGDGQLAAQIVSLMSRERLYARQRFTISDLAAELGLHENKLRKTINNEMEFRNFNQFLNHYRLQEASQLLRQTEEPVSAIAYKVGYSSLSSFNSVFKSQFAVTPTEYRMSALTG